MAARTRMYLMLLSVSAIWGATFAVMKEATKELTPLLIVFGRVGVAGLFYACTLLFVGKKAKLHLKDIPLFFLLGLLGISVFMPLQIYAVSYTYASHASMLIAMTPVMATLIAWMLGMQKMKVPIFIGLALAISGVTLLASQSAVGAGAQASNIILGDLLVLLSGFMWAAFSLLGTTAMKKYSPLVAVAYIHLFGFLQLLAFSVFQQELWPVYWNQIQGVSLSTGMCILFLGVLASYYAFFIWYRGIEMLGPVKTTTFQYFNPLFGSVTAMLLLGEPITFYLVGGGAFIIGGVWMTNRNR